MGRTPATAGRCAGSLGDREAASAHVLRVQPVLRDGAEVVAALGRRFGSGAGGMRRWRREGVLSRQRVGPSPGGWGEMSPERVRELVREAHSAALDSEARSLDWRPQATPVDAWHEALTQLRNQGHISYDMEEMDR